MRLMGRLALLVVVEAALLASPWAEHLMVEMQNGEAAVVAAEPLSVAAQDKAMAARLFLGPAVVEWGQAKYLQLPLRAAGLREPQLVEQLLPLLLQILQLLKAATGARGILQAQQELPVVSMAAVAAVAVMVLPRVYITLVQVAQVVMAQLLFIHGEQNAKVRTSWP